MTQNSPEATFPKRIDISYKESHPLYDPEYYCMREVDSWIRACIENRPDPDEYDAASWDMFLTFERRWFEKWFSQFQTPNRKVIEK